VGRDIARLSALGESKLPNSSDLHNRAAAPELEDLSIEGTCARGSGDYGEYEGRYKHIDNCARLRPGDLVQSDSRLDGRHHQCLGTRLARLSLSDDFVGILQLVDRLVDSACAAPMLAPVGLGHPPAHQQNRVAQPRRPRSRDADRADLHDNGHQPITAHARP
jgi:hypothetical protein